MPYSMLDYGPFRKVEAGPDGLTLYLYGRRGATIEQVQTWLKNIWGDEEGKQLTLGDIGTEQFRVMLRLPE